MTKLERIRGCAGVRDTAGYIILSNDSSLHSQYKSIWFGHNKLRIAKPLPQPLRMSQAPCKSVALFYHHLLVILQEGQLTVYSPWGISRTLLRRSLSCKQTESWKEGFIFGFHLPSHLGHLWRMLGVIIVILSPWEKSCYIAKPTPKLPTSRLHLCKIKVSQDFWCWHPMYPDWCRCSSRNKFNKEGWLARKRAQSSSGNRKSHIILFLCIIFIVHFKCLKWRRLMLIFHFSPGRLLPELSLCANKMYNPARVLRPASTSAWIPSPAGSSLASFRPLLNCPFLSDNPLWEDISLYLIISSQGENI